MTKIKVFVGGTACNCFIGGLPFCCRFIDSRPFFISSRRASVQALLQSEILLFGAKQSARRIYKVRPAAGTSDSHVDIHAAFSGAPRPTPPSAEVQRGFGANYSAAVGRFKSRPNGQRLVKNILGVGHERGAARWILRFLPLFPPPM